MKAPRHIYLAKGPWATMIIVCLVLISVQTSFASEGPLPTPSEWIESVLASPHLINIDTPPAQRPKVYRFIKTNEYVDLLGNTDVQSRQQQQELKRWLDREALSRPIVKDVIIPVVFHIIYHDDKSRITEAQVMSQLDALNRDYSGTVRDRLAGRPHQKAYKAQGFEKQGGEIHIQFCLGTRRVGNRVEKGIQYHQTDRQSWALGNEIKGKDTGSEAWDEDRYLNVWVTTTEERMSGYAQPPGWSASTDGIVIDHHYFGTQGTALEPYHMGRTMTHLVANFLGVPSLWGLQVCGDDGIDDTPLHNEPNFGCPRYQHVSTCTHHPSEMTMNFLDNTDDACMYFFTQKQVDRMYASLIHGGPRHQLWDHGGTLCQEVSPDIPEEMPQDRSTPYLQVYPNPAKGYFMLESGQLDFGKSITVVIRDLVGREVYRSTNMQANAIEQIDCNTWSKGIYFVIIDNVVERPYQKITIQ